MRPERAGLPAVTALAFIAAAVCGGAQPAAQLSVAGGTGTDERGVTSSSITVAPGFVLGAGSRVAASVGGSATRFETGAMAVGGTATVTARTTTVAGAALILNAGVGASRSSFGTTITVADATPAAEWTAGPVSFFGGARVASGRTTVRTAGTPPEPIPGRSTLREAARTSVGSVFGASWNVLGTPTWPLVATYREERARVNGVAAIDRAAGVSVSVGALSAVGSLGERFKDTGNRQFATAALSYALTPVVSLDVAVGRYLPDRLTGTPDGRYVVTGLTFRRGGSAPQPPLPSGVTPPARGMTRLAIRAPDAKRVDLYGDWNDWTPIAARHASNGVWYVDVPLAPGEYRYAFRIDQAEWRVPEGVVAAADGFGARSAYVVVADTTTAQGRNSREVR